MNLSTKVPHFQDSGVLAEGRNIRLEGQQIAQLVSDRLAEMYAVYPVLYCEWAVQDEFKNIGGFVFRDGSWQSIDCGNRFVFGETERAIVQWADEFGGSSNV